MHCPPFFLEKAVLTDHEVLENFPAQCERSHGLECIRLDHHLYHVISNRFVTTLFFILTKFPKKTSEKNEKRLQIN